MAAKTFTKENALEITKEVVRKLRDKEAEDLVVIDVSESMQMVDYFVIITCNSDTHMAAIRDMLVYDLKHLGMPIMSYDKGKGYDWMIVDASAVMVHMFTKEGRKFYDLDGLWSEYGKIEL